jgi:hypothetical protein
MRVTFAGRDELRMCLKIGLQNVAKIARNNDIFGAIDERNLDTVQAPAGRQRKLRPIFPETLARGGHCRVHPSLTRTYWRANTLVDSILY